MLRKKILMPALIMIFLITGCFSFFPNASKSRGVKWVRPKILIDNFFIGWDHRHWKKWQPREGNCDLKKAIQASTIWSTDDLIERVKNSTTDRERLIRIQAHVLAVTSAGDDISIDKKLDYWTTSCETVKRYWGDCEDTSILMYRFIYELAEYFNHPDIRSHTGVVSARRGFYDWHRMVAVYFADSDDFWIFDNGHWCAGVNLGSEWLLQNADIKPIGWFNLNELVKLKKIYID